MSRINYRLVIYYFAIYVLLQLPLLYKFVFFQSAFGFFYIGFLLLIPFGVNPFIRLLIGFAVGLIIDVFSNTPGLHAAASTLLMLVRDNWLLVAKEDLEDDSNLSIFRLGFRGTLVYMLPLLFVHLLVVLTIEHGKLLGYGLVLKRVFLSTIFTFVCIVVFNMLVAPRTRRI